MDGKSGHVKCERHGEANGGAVNRVVRLQPHDLQSAMPCAALSAWFLFFFESMLYALLAVPAYIAFFLTCSFLLVIIAFSAGIWLVFVHPHCSLCLFLLVVLSVDSMQAWACSSYMFLYERLGLWRIQ